MQDKYISAMRTFEGFTARASWDYKQSSNGYGTRALSPGEVIDKDEAERRFQAEILDARNSVLKFSPNLDDGTLAALTSLTFNVGSGWTRARLGDAVKAGDSDAIRTIFKEYTKAGGEVLPGLVSRRQTESEWIGQGLGLPITGAAEVHNSTEANSAVDFDRPPLTRTENRTEATVGPYHEIVLMLLALPRRLSIDALSRPSRDDKPQSNVV